MRDLGAIRPTRPDIVNSEIDDEVLEPKYLVEPKKLKEPIFDEPDFYEKKVHRKVD